MPCGRLCDTDKWYLPTSMLISHPPGSSQDYCCFTEGTLRLKNVNDTGREQRHELSCLALSHSRARFFFFSYVDYKMFKHLKRLKVNTVFSVCTPQLGNETKPISFLQNTVLPFMTYKWKGFNKAIEQCCRCLNEASFQWNFKKTFLYKLKSCLWIFQRSQ